MQGVGQFMTAGTPGPSVSGKDVGQDVPPSAKIALVTNLSFLDVVDARLGVSASSRDVMRLEERELLELAELLTEFYEDWEPSRPGDAEIRVFLPTSTTLYTDWHPGMPVPTAPVQQLLYVDSLAVEDPASSAVFRLCRRRTGRVTRHSRHAPR